LSEYLMFCQSVKVKTGILLVTALCGIMASDARASGVALYMAMSAQASLTICLTEQKPKFFI
uniref:hypothetical protein n=1 Tax=Lelliottia sp. WAP21 TaxID=2877426 RepID=UPI001F2064AA